LGEYKKFLLLVPFLVLLEVLSELSMPLLMAKVIDIGIPGKNVEYITRIGLYMIVLALAAIGVLVILKTAVARYSIVQEKIDLLNNTLQENLTVFAW
jgi:ATP-binding cassette subfamily B protein